MKQDYQQQPIWKFLDSQPLQKYWLAPDYVRIVAADLFSMHCCDLHFCREKPLIVWKTSNTNMEINVSIQNSFIKFDIC